jgi:hypothetical protein
MGYGMAAYPPLGPRMGDWSYYPGQTCVNCRDIVSFMPRSTATCRCAMAWRIYFDLYT